MDDDVAAFVDLLGEASLGGEGVVDADDRRSCEVAQGAGDAVVRVDVADDPSAPVHEHDQRRGPLGVRAVVAHPHLAVAGGDLAVGGRGHRGAALVPEGALGAVRLAHLLEALAGDVGAGGELVLFGDDCAHLLGPQARHIVFVAHSRPHASFLALRLRATTTRAKAHTAAMSAAPARMRKIWL